jgi:hypothetical protein
LKFSPSSSPRSFKSARLNSGFKELVTEDSCRDNESKGRTELDEIIRIEETTPEPVFVLKLEESEAQSKPVSLSIALIDPSPAVLNTIESKPQDETFET